MHLNRRADSYFIIRIDHPRQQHQRRVIITIIVALCATLAGIWYFFPQVPYYVTEYINQQIPNFIPQEPVRIATTDIPPAKTSMVVSSPPPVVPVSPTPEVKETPIQLPPTNVVTQPTSPTLPSGDSVESLLARAEGQMTKTRLTSPPGDNAYETYQILSKIDPQQAQKILDGIVFWYINQGRRYLNQNKITQPQSGNAYQMYQKAQEIAPNHNAVQPFLKEINDLLKERLNEQTSGKLSDPEGNSAYNTLQDLLVVSADKNMLQNSTDKIVNELLKKAEQQMIKKYYTTPEKDNAYISYQKVLKIAPNNPKAQAGLNQIGEKYFWLAVDKKRQRNYVASLELVKKGLEIAPQHAELLKLKQDIMTQSPR
jgi:hypothetical protein